jgi:hypothetical protein
MKALIYISGILGFLLIMVGAFFRILHLPGANELLLFGIVLDVLVFAPLLIVYSIRKRRTAEQVK